MPVINIYIEMNVNYCVFTALIAHSYCPITIQSVLKSYQIKLLSLVVNNVGIWFKLNVNHSQGNPNESRVLTDVNGVSDYSHCSASSHDKMVLFVLHTKVRDLITIFSNHNHVIHQRGRRLQTLMLSTCQTCPLCERPML